MHILFVSRLLPHPWARSSGEQDTFHYIQSLADRGHVVSLIAFVTEQERAHLPALQVICRQVIPIPYWARALAPRLWRAGWRFLLPKVYGRNVSLSYWRALRRLRESNIDAVVVDGAMGLYGPLLKLPFALDEVDIYTQVLRHQYETINGRYLSLLARYEWQRTAYIERRLLERANMVLVRSEKDRAWLRERNLGPKSTVVGPWFEGLDSLQYIPVERPAGNDILFMGALQNPKNIEAVQFFGKEVFPLIRAQLPDARFIVVGGAPDASLYALAEAPGIQLVGEVDDLTPVYRQCAVNVVPLLTGGGIIVKTLNGMAAARPTVTTPMGASGIDAENGRDLIITPAAPRPIADAVISILKDPLLWQKLARNGRDFVRRNCEWRKTVDRLESALIRLIQE